MLKNKNQSSIAKEKLIEILFEDLTYEILPERYFLLALSVRCKNMTFR